MQTILSTVVRNLSNGKEYTICTRSNNEHERYMRTSLFDLAHIEANTWRILDEDYTLGSTVTVKNPYTDARFYAEVISQISREWDFTKPVGQRQISNTKNF